MNYGLNAKTIIRLLLDFAPKTVLEELEIAESTHDEWVESLESEQSTKRGYRTMIDMSSLALYYAARKRNIISGKLFAYGKVEIDLHTLYDFAELAKTEDSVEVEKLIKELEKEKRQRHMAKARTALTPKHDWNAVANLEAELLSVGIHQRNLAGIIETRLGVPPSTYREWRKRKTTV